jgi:hypothetical protein
MRVAIFAGMGIAPMDCLREYIGTGDPAKGIRLVHNLLHPLRNGFLDGNKPNDQRRFKVNSTLQICAI